MRVINSFKRLRHHTVVGSDDEHAATDMSKTTGAKRTGLTPQSQPISSNLQERPDR